MSALLSLLQENIITESKISSLIFLLQLDVVFSKWFNVVCKLTANVQLNAAKEFVAMSDRRCCLKLQKFTDCVRFDSRQDWERSKKLLAAKNPSGRNKRFVEC